VGAPYTNALVVDPTRYNGGQASPGTISSVSDVNILSSSPSVTRRSAWIGGGGALVDPTVVIHEIGHTLHWPHSFIGPGEYDNPLDVMSASPTDPFDDPGSDLWDVMCSLPGGGGWVVWCIPQNTLAFNRLASDWISGGQVAIHRSGLANYTLDRPHGGGVQMVALPSAASAHDLMVIEARPATFGDAYLEQSGVAVHLIDQDNNFEGISTQRGQRQANGEPDSYDHVITPGQTVSWHGVTISVIAAAGDGFVVSVSGSYQPPFAF
jgi:hypothetical protein